jgi:hypothetical protein
MARSARGVALNADLASRYKRRLVREKYAKSSRWPYSRSGPGILRAPGRETFHGGNTGSSPVGDANFIKQLQIPSRILYVL